MAPPFTLALEINLEQTYLVWIIKKLYKEKVIRGEFLTIDELFVVSSDLWTIIDLRFGEIFMIILEKSICCFSNYDSSTLA